MPDREHLVVLHVAGDLLRELLHLFGVVELAVGDDDRAASLGAGLLLLLQIGEIGIVGIGLGRICTAFAVACVAALAIAHSLAGAGFNYLCLLGELVGTILGKRACHRADRD